MEIEITFRNMEATDALRDYAETKLQKLKKYMHKPVSAHVILNAEQHKNHIAEVVINSDNTRYTGTDNTNDMYASIDGAIHKLETQLRKHKERIKNHKTL